MPSAIPRNREYDPRVTTRGGMFSRAIRIAFSNPPAQPVSKAAITANGSGKCQSVQTTPKATAAKPIIEPTERSMPPEMMTGVNATASKPSSTLNRATSKKFAELGNFGATAENTATSASNARNSTHSPFGNQHSRQRLRANGCGGRYGIVSDAGVRP